MIRTSQLLCASNNYRVNAVTNPVYCGDKCSEDLDSEDHAVMTPRSEDNMESEAVPEIQEAEGKDEISPGNCYDGIVPVKFASYHPTNQKIVTF